MGLRRNNHKSTPILTSPKPAQDYAGFLRRFRRPFPQGTRNIGHIQGLLPNRLILMIVILACCRSCSSDFNVIIPEICNMTESSNSLNISWIADMVHLGIREELPGLSLNILKPEGNIIIFYYILDILLLQYFKRLGRIYSTLFYINVHIYLFQHPVDN